MFQLDTSSWPVQRQWIIETKSLVGVPLPLQARKTLKFPSRIQSLGTLISMAVVDIQCKVFIATRFCKIGTRIVQKGTDDLVQSRVNRINVFI